MSKDELLAMLVAVEQGISEDCEYITATYRGSNQDIRYGVAWVLKSAVQHAIAHLSNTEEGADNE